MSLSHQFNRGIGFPMSLCVRRLVIFTDGSKECQYLIMINDHEFYLVSEALM